MADLRPSETSPDPKQLKGLFQTESAGEIVRPPNHSHRFRTCAIERDIRLFLLGSPQQKKSLVQVLLMHWAESPKTPGADSVDSVRILIELQRVVRPDQSLVFSE